MDNQFVIGMTSRLIRTIAGAGPPHPITSHPIAVFNNAGRCSFSNPAFYQRCARPSSEIDLDSAVQLFMLERIRFDRVADLAGRLRAPQLLSWRAFDGYEAAALIWQFAVLGAWQVAFMIYREAYASQPAAIKSLV